MVISLRRFASNAALSVLQVLVSGVILFLLYRYLLKHLGAEQLGLWSVLLASTSFARLSDFGLTGGVVKFVARYRGKDDPVGASEVVQTTVLTIAVVMGVVLVALYPLLIHILNWTLPAASIHEARSILPWAVLSVWVGAIAGVFQAGIDGCQRAGLRHIISIGGNVFLIVCVIWFVPKYGLEALARVQVAQWVVVGIANWVLLRFLMKELPLLPWRWSKPRFKEMLGYGLNFQFVMIAVMLCDPVTKLLMSRFGGLSSAAYYEMASQLVIRVRTLLVSANAVIVPVIAELQEKSPEKLRDVYVRAYETVFFLALPVYAGMFLLLPLVSEVWIGHVEPQFIVFAAILIGTYFLNNLEVPAYFDNLGTGELGWNSVAHFTMAGLNAALGALFGYLWGAVGVSAGASIALLVSSAMVLWFVNRKYKVPMRQLIPRDHRLIAVVIGCVTIAGIAWLAWIQTQGLSILTNTGMAVAAFVAAYVAVGWRHPYRHQLERSWRDHFSGTAK